MPRIARWIRDKDRSLAKASLSALGRIGGIEAARALGQTSVGLELESLRNDALLLCADGMLEGHRLGALAIYRDMAKSDNPSATRIAAYRGLLKAAPEEAPRNLLSVLNDEDADVRRAAGVLIRGRTAGSFRNPRPLVVTRVGLSRWPFQQLPHIQTRWLSPGSSASPWRRAS